MCNGDNHQAGVADRRQGDEGHTTGKVVQRVGGGLERQASLANAARPGEGEQPHIRVPQ
jgi:hypothetical protein